VYRVIVGLGSLGISRSYAIHIQRFAETYTWQICLSTNASSVLSMRRARTKFRARWA